jgi:RND family efflux transporter MFP subunit
MKNTKGIVVIVAILAVGVGGILMGRSLEGNRTKGGEDSPGKPAGKVSLGYSKQANPAAASVPDRSKSDIPTARVESVTEETAIRLTGTLTADEKSDVASTANGIVQEVLVERGSLVEKGDVLVKVDPTDMKNMLAEGLAAVEELKAALGWDGRSPFKVAEQPGVQMAKAALDLATTNYKRYSELFSQNAVSKAAFDQIQTEYDASQQRYQQALHQARQLYQSYHTALTRVDMLRKAVADTTIVAPFSGWVAEKFVSTGERVTTNPMGSGSKIVTLVRVDPLRLILTVPQQQVAAVREGQTVRFRVDSLPDRTFSGEVKFVGPSVESMSRSLTVEAVVANPDRVLRPGFFATAELMLAETKTELLVPASAVVKLDDVAKVYVVRDGKAVEQVVSVGDTRNDRVFVTSGLTGSDVVVTTPERIQDGERID